MIASPKFLMVIGLLGALGVAMGAFGAHALPGYLASLGLEEAVLQKRLDQFRTAVQYHLLHTLACLALAALATPITARRFRIAVGLMLLGMLCFCGSLYGLSISGIKQLAHVAPLGGMLLIASWLSVASAGWPPTASGARNGPSTPTMNGK
ncbi:MAG: DUF423 domain-containing protein [Pirellulaceae bacterium]